MKSGKRSKKRGMKTILSAFLAVALFVSTIVVDGLEVKAKEVYAYPTTIRNLLSDYQYVTKGELSAKTHNIGGFICGGEAKLSYVGQGMISSSYAYKLEEFEGLESSKTYLSENGYANSTVYYGSYNSSKVASWIFSDSRFHVEQYTGFINVDNAFTSLYAESASMAASSVTATKNGSMIEVDLSEGSDFVIPASMLETGAATVINIKGVTSPSDFATKSCHISITGINNSSLKIDFNNGYDSSYDYHVNVAFNGSTENATYLLDGVGDFNPNGTKIVTNLPDASGNVAVNFLNGHLVAPKAAVEVSGGHFEGGVIADSVNNLNSEGHFYPYYKIGASRTGESVKTKGIILTDLNLDAVVIGDSVFVTEIKDENNNQVPVNNENADFQWQYKDRSEWKDIAGEKGIQFTANDTYEGKEIRCKVTGKNGYEGTVYAESIVKAKSPVEEGKTETTITIEAEPGYEYELRKPDGTIVKPWVEDGEGDDGDRNTGTITFTGLTPSTDYEVVKRVVDKPVTGSPATKVSTIKVIVATTLSLPEADINTPITVTSIADKKGNPVVVNTENATYQWQYEDNGTWKNISGATEIAFTPTKELEGKKIRCQVVGKNDYSGTAYAESIVKLQAPVEKDKSETSITIEADSDYEYELRKPDGTIVKPWVSDGKSTDGDKITGTITFTDLEPDTAYTVVKRKKDNPALVSTVTTLKTKKTSDGEPIKPGSVELNIPTIVMKKVLGKKQKFKIKLLNYKGAKIRCSSSNKKIATIDKKGLVKTKKKVGKCKLVINVSKGKKKIQYIVNLHVRNGIDKNYSLYKYKTKYKDPSVSLYKLINKGGSYKIKLLHLSKEAKVTYKSNKPFIATVSKSGKVKGRKNGRADITITVKQNGITYTYFVVARVATKGKWSDTSYLKVIK